MGKKDDLKTRVEQFQMLELPEQPLAMHMGTSYLVNDLWGEVQRLRSQQAHPAESIEKPLCEICGAIATCGVRDIKCRDNFNTGFVDRKPYGPPHLYCDAHERNSHKYNVTMSPQWQNKHPNDEW